MVVDESGSRGRSSEEKAAACLKGSASKHTVHFLR